MPKDLTPKPTSRNIKQLEQRLAMLARGWPPLPCEGKGLIIEVWNTIDITEQLIRDWDSYRRGLGCKFAGTGVRITGSMFVIDLDIKEPEIINDALDAIEARFPEFLRGSLWRHSGGVSLALFGQISRPVGGYHSATYGRRESDGTITGKAHFETYGSATSGKYFACYGPHSDPSREYGWEGPSPVDTDLSSLPVLDADQLDELHAVIAAALARHLEKIEPERALAGLHNVYDLTPESLFWLKDGSTESLKDLETRLEIGPTGVRGTLSAEDHALSDSKERCHAFRRERSGRLMVTDHYRDVNHYFVGEEPPPPFEISDEDRERLQALTGPPTEPAASAAEPEPAKNAAPEEVLAFLLRNYAVDRHSGMIVDLRATAPEQALIEIKTFHLIYGAHRFYTPPKKSGDGKWTPVANLFLIHPDHIIVDGIRFRPEAEFPIFREGDRLYKNIWLRPRHTGDCDLTFLLDSFFPIFIPAAIERNWYLDVTAHRWMRPEIPGPSVVLVAHGAESAINSDYGTGRSGWFDFLARLFGRQYVRNMDFAAVVGDNRQGDFTAWKAYRRLITVDEAKVRPGGDSRAEAVSTYERVKAMVDPARRWRMFHVKYGKAFEDWDYAPMDIASNHQNALQIPPGDRRFGVVMNGRALTAAEKMAFYAVINHPGAPAAFARWCEARDISAFRAYDPPPVFSGKARMQALSETEMDVVFDEMMARFGRLFTKSQARTFAVQNLETAVVENDPLFGKRFEAAFRHYCTVLRSKKDGEDPRATVPIVGLDVDKVGQLKVGQWGTKRERIYTFEARNVDELLAWVATAKQAEVAKSGLAVGQKVDFEVHKGGKGPHDGPVGQSGGHK